MYRLFLAIFLGLSGCARQQAKPDWQGVVSTPAPQTEAVIVTPTQANAGRISIVNPSARYAIITYSLGVPLPGVDRRLNVYRGGLKVAELRITGPSRDGNTIGDILTGECQPGDQVREN